MTAVLYILLGAAMPVASSYAAGRLLLARTAIDVRGGQLAAVAFVTGSAVMSLVVFALCAAGAVHKGTLIAAAAIPVAWAARRGLLRIAASAPVSRSRSDWILLALFAVYAALYAVNAIAPEISPDGSTYRLGLVARYYRDHGFQPLTTNMYAALSQGVEMLYLMAWPFGRHSAAAVVHFVYLLALARLMAGFARRAGLDGAALAAALIVFASPVVGVDATSAYNDVAVAAIVFTLFFLIESGSEPAPAGLLAGFAYAAKYTAFLAVPYMLWRLRLRPIAAACAAAAMLPWIAKNAIVWHNPFAPFFNSWFPNPFVLVSFEQYYRGEMANPGGAGFATLLADSIAGGQINPGMLGAVFFAAPVALLAMRDRLGRRLLAAAAIFGIAFAANKSARFLIPAAPFVVLAIALALRRAPVLVTALAVAQCVLAWPARLPDTGFQIRGWPWKAALRIAPEDTYRAERSYQYRVARMIERSVPPGAKVFSTSPVAEAFTTRDVIISYYSAGAQSLHDVVWSAATEDYRPVERVRFQTRAPAPVPRVRVAIISGESDREWMVSRIRLYRGGVELARTPSWRIASSHFPWALDNAFDERPLRVWRSGDKARAGMFIEVAFGLPERVDEVVIDQLPAGGFELGLDIEADRTVETAPFADPARAAIGELKHRGIGYLLIDRVAGGPWDRALAGALPLVDSLPEAAVYRIE
ncbi:MAG: glycosyltransferase 87 family protein [Bryobacteraceae bacterium]